MRINRIAILGDGIVGWMAAAALQRGLSGSGITITIVPVAGEDASLDPFGQGAAILPEFHSFLDALEVEEADLLRAARGCFSLGGVFLGWSRPDTDWFAPFGDVGAPLNGAGFYDLAARLRNAGHRVRMADFSLAAMAAAQGRFAHPLADRGSVRFSYGYGLHLHLGGFANLLRSIAPKVELSAAPYQAAIRADDGVVQGLRLEDGNMVAGDLFLDCSGAQALLCASHGFEDWSHWLPVNRAISRVIEREGALPPYSHAAAHRSGWLRTVTLNGALAETWMYDAAHVSEDALASFDAASATTFVQGRRSRAWCGNVIALGAAACVLEPLHGHALQMAANAIQRLLVLFPADLNGPEAAEYNRLTASETDRVRDFVIGHYKTNARDGEPFWDAARGMAVPEMLQHKLDVFASRGRVPIYDDEVFETEEWAALLDGQGVHPRRCDALAEAMPEGVIIQHMIRLHRLIAEAAQSMPSHHVTLQRMGLTR